MLATKKQIEYATEMIIKLGYDLDDYDFEKMTKEEGTDLINELKRELD